MAFYQNGLYLTDPTGSVPAGFVLSRWLFEWLTQVVGWTAHDTQNSRWTDVIASGTGATAGATTADSTKVDMSSSGRSWTSADIGKYITVTGLTTTLRDGVYRIKYVEPSDIVVLDTKRGVHEDGLPNSETFDWRLWDYTTTYTPGNEEWAVVRGAYSHTPAEPNFDVRIEADSSEAGVPNVAIGPFGTWNNSTHAWSDSRNTTQLTTDSGSEVGEYVWAYADGNHAIVFYGSFYSTTILLAPRILYFGEVTVPDTTADPNPGIIIQAYRGASQSDQRQLWRTFIGIDNSRSRWMSKLPANNTEVQGFFQTPTQQADSGQWWELMQGSNRQYTEWSKGIYRIDIQCECRTAGHMEQRGILKDLWCSGANLQPAMPFGASHEFINLCGGFSMPWNGSRSHVQF
jgi:hypothetical protein